MKLNHNLNNNNPHKLTKAQLGLSNVDNTSDEDKPVSNAVKQELDKKALMENGVIEIKTKYESADAIPVFTKTGAAAKKLDDVHCGVFKVSFNPSLMINDICCKFICNKV